MEQVSIVLTYCHYYGPRHGALKTRRQSDDTDGVSQGALWRIDGYSGVDCTSLNIHTVLVSELLHLAWFCSFCIFLSNQELSYTHANLKEMSTMHSYQWFLQ